MTDINHIEADNMINDLTLFFITECVHKAWVIAIYRWRAIAKIVKKEMNAKIQDNVIKMISKDSAEEIISRTTQKNELIAVHRSTMAKFRTKIEQGLGRRIPNSKKPFKSTPIVETIIRHISCTSSFALDCTGCNVMFLMSHIFNLREENRKKYILLLWQLIPAENVIAHN